MRRFLNYYSRLAMDKEIATILKNMFYEATLVFLPENLLRETKRQKNISSCKLPDICAGPIISLSCMI